MENIIYIPVYITEDFHRSNSNFFFTDIKDAENYAKDFVNRSRYFTKYIIETYNKY